MAKKVVKDEIELSKEQKSIVATRKRINRRELESEKVDPFSKYKTITYIFIFLFTPYGLYRIWNKDSTFKYGEKLVYTMIAIIYFITIVNAIFKL